MCTVMQQMSPAAAFVAKHYDQIVKYGHRFFGSLPDGNREDAIQALLLYCLEHHHQLRLENARNPKAVISNWIYFQCAAVRKLTFNKVKNAEKAKKAYVKGNDLEAIYDVGDTVDGRGYKQRGMMISYRKAFLVLTGEEAYSNLRIDDMEAAELIDRLYDMASEEEKSAMIAVELELDARESKKAGVPVKKQMELLRRLGQRAEAAGISVLY